MKTQHKRTHVRPDHTQLFLISLLFGYGIFLSWLGLRWIIILSGATIIMAMVGLWHLSPKPLPRTGKNIPGHNLLETDAFLAHIHALDSQIDPINQDSWQSSRHQIVTIQQLVQRLAQRETTFIPDLLETLHTVLKLAQQLVDALQVSQQVRTPHYRELATQQLTISQSRLHQTHTQLEFLHDQLMVTELKRTSVETIGGMAERLQVLITENTQSIQEPLNS